MDRIGEVFRIPWINNESAIERLCRAGEFRENHYAMSLALRGDVFVRDKIHAIPSTRYETGIRDGVEGGEFFETDGLVEEVNGHEFNGAKAAIDATDKFVDDSSQVLVFFDILARGDRDLDEYYFTDPFGVFGEEDFKGVQFLRDAFDIVESVDSDDEFDTFKFALELGDAF